MNYRPNRIPKGQSSGGQFSRGRKSESSVSLMPPSDNTVDRPTQLLEDHLGAMNRQEYSEHVKSQQKQSVFARLNPPPAPDDEGIIEPDVMVASGEENERLDSICDEIRETLEARSWVEREKFKPYGLASYELDALAEKHDLPRQSIKDLIGVSSGGATTGNSDTVAKNLRTGRARATYSKLSEAGADLSFVPAEYDHDPGVLHFGAMFNRNFSARINDTGRMEFSHVELEKETFRDADARNAHDVRSAYYEAVNRGLDYELGRTSGIGGHFDPELGKVFATRRGDDAQFTYDVRTRETTSPTGHLVPSDGLHNLAQRAYSHPLVVSRNSHDFPHTGVLTNNTENSSTPR